MADRSYIKRNDGARARLSALIDRLTDTDMGRDLGGGWTVGAALAHVAFWERRVLVLMERWQRQPVQEIPEEDDLINRALLPEWLLLPPDAVRGYVNDTLTAVDATVAAASDELIEAIRTGGETVNLERVEHRDEHLAQIEAALKS